MTVLAVLLTLLGLAGAFWTVTGEVVGTYWVQFWGSLLLMCVGAGLGGRRKASAWLLPAVVPFVLLLLWQGLVIGFGVPKGIFPSVTDVWASLRATFPVLLRDAYVTFVKEILLGFVIGFSTGFVAGVGIAGSRFLQRGFLPLAAAFGAVPIVGLAPVLGRAFGFDWESKAAVVPGRAQQPAPSLAGSAPMGYGNGPLPTRGAYAADNGSDQSSQSYPFGDRG